MYYVAHFYMFIEYFILVLLNVRFNVLVENALLPSHSKIKGTLSTSKIGCFDEVACKSS